MSARIDKIATGIAGLEILTKGGIPRGRTTLITGRSGTGKSILALELACAFARQEAPAMYVAVEERPADLIGTADGLGFAADALIEGKRLQFVDLRRPADGSTHVTGDYDIGGLTDMLIQTAAASGTKLVVIDSVTALFHPLPNDGRVRGLVFQLVNGLEEAGLTVVLTAEAPSDYTRATALGVEDYVCDLVLVLRNVVDGKRRRRSIEAQKYRRSAHLKGEYPFTITDRGVTIFPMDATEEHTLSEGDRFSSGVPGLDAMNAGGWLRDSIIIVRGPTGSGKTTLAGLYVRAGVQRGERVAYYGFEETRPMLLRNFKQMGIAMAEYEAAGNLRLACRYPEASSPEDLLVELRRDLDDFMPTLIVLDSISSVEHSTSSEGFRMFMVGLAALLRERGRSALMTQTIAAHAEAQHDPPFLSTIADAILALDYSTGNENMERTARVLKMRGSAHATHRCRMTIHAEGVTVLGPPAGSPATR